MGVCIDSVPHEVFQIAARYVVIMHKSSLDALEIALDKLHHEDEELVLDDLVPKLKEAIDRISNVPARATISETDAEAAAIKAATCRYDAIVRGMQLPTENLESVWRSVSTASPAEASSWEHTLDTLDMLELRLQKCEDNSPCL
jgi:hypothetical protein